MPTNRISQANRQGRKAHSLQLHYPSTELAEPAAPAGMEGIDLDGEHGPFDHSKIDEICRAAKRLIAFSAPSALAALSGSPAPHGESHGVGACFPPRDPGSLSITCASR